MPTGITGLARPREWDLTTSLDLPELRGEPEGEIAFLAFREELVFGSTLAGEALGRITPVLDAELARPYEALLVRQGETVWAVAAKRLNAELIRLPGVEAESLAVAVAPDRSVSLTLDGAPVETSVDPEIADAFRGLESRGRARFQAFVARADNLGEERWQLTLDPL